MDAPEYTRITVHLIGQTDLAAYVAVNGEQHWIPWKLVEDNGEDFVTGYHGEMYVETWFLHKEGIET